MRQARIVSLGLLVILAASGSALAGMWDVPVAPGETFRWVFVTSDTTPATDTDIGFYNTFVNSVANTAGTAIAGVDSKATIAEINWLAIASTPTMDAISNIGASPSGIYTPWGDLVANGTGDLFDGSIATAINTTETGSTVNSHVSTGSGSNGLRVAGGELGSSLVFIGRSWVTGSDWIYTGLANSPTVSAPIYAISEELTAQVVPVPGAALLGVLGLGVAGWRLQRR